MVRGCGWSGDGFGIAGPGVGMVARLCTTTDILRRFISRLSTPRAQGERVNAVTAETQVFRRRHDAPERTTR